MTRLSVIGPSLLVALALAPGRAAADEGDCSHVTRANVASCAVAVSATVRGDEQAWAAAGARRDAARPWVPSNPLLSLTAARREATEGRPTALNLYATLSQELEIAGQRGARLRSAEADISARHEDVVATRRRVAAAAYVAYYEALAARDALAIAQRLESTGAQIAKVTRARAEAGVASALDAEITDAAFLRLAQNRVAAERDQRRDAAGLAVLLGRDPLHPSLTVEGTLDPLPGSDEVAAGAAASKPRERPEVRALLHEQRSFEANADAYRRARVPNVTLQIYAQNDGYNEHVFGGGLSAPIPLPEPVGRFNAGLIAESDALAHRSSERADAAVRELTADLASAVTDYETRRAEAELYRADRAARTATVMSEIGKEIESGRLAVRDAVIAQQQLIDVIRGYVETRRALCIASVKLAVAANVPIEGAR